MTKEKDEIVETKVDKDIHDFLKAIYFGDFTDPLKVASSRVYRDMNRTIRFNGLPDATRLVLREKVNAVFDAELSKLKADSITSQDEFDAWHHSVSDKIKKLYLDEGVKLTYGHAQKGINMTIKYLYMLEANSLFIRTLVYLYLQSKYKNRPDLTVRAIFYFLSAWISPI